MQYTASRPSHGDPDKAFDLALAALTSLGFRLDQRTTSSVELSGPGMNSNRQSPLLGASRLNISFREGQLDLAAELQAAERLARFARVFSIALTFVLGLTLLIVFGTMFAGRAAPLLWLGPVVGVTLLNGGVWAVLGPLIPRNIQRRTRHGLESLLTTMVVNSERAGENADCAITS